MRIVMFGTGMVADTHLSAIKDLKSQITLAGVLGRSKQKMTEFAHKASALLEYSVPALTQLPDPSEFDAAVILTPPDAREIYVNQLCQMGKPILMEKPIERTQAAAERLVNLCDACDVPLAIVFQHRTRAEVQKLKNMLNDGQFGKVLIVDIRVPWWRDQAYYDAPGRGTYARDGGGVLLTQAIHTIDLALWLVGRVEEVQGLCATTPLHKMEAEDWAGALLQFQCGAFGSLFATTANFPGGAETISLQTEKASVQLSAGQLVIHWHDGRKESIGGIEKSGGGADPMAFSHAWHKNILENFLETAKFGSEPIATGESALIAHRLIHAIETSSETGQKERVK